MRKLRRIEVTRSHDLNTEGNFAELRKRFREIWKDWKNNVGMLAEGGQFVEESMKQEPTKPSRLTAIDEEVKLLFTVGGGGVIEPSASHWS